MDVSAVSRDSARKPEDLVAYLDGELGDDDATEVERSLAEDPGVRQEVESLTRTWDLLDLLPVARAGDGFAEKTMTAIKSNPTLAIVEEGNDSGSNLHRASLRERGRRMGFRIMALLGLMLVAGIGFGSTFHENSKPMDQLLREYPLIHRLDEYREADSVEFLRELEKSGLFDERPGKVGPKREVPNVD